MNPLEPLLGRFRDYLAKNRSYPQEVKGKQVFTRSVIAYILMAVYFILPWIKINGSPFIQLSFWEGSYTLFFQKALIQDFFNIVFILIFLIISLFFISSTVGRVWCGVACPQTIFMEHFIRKVERAIEGSAHSRRKRDSNPWSLTTSLRKLVKLLIVFAICVLFSFTFLSYWVGTETLLNEANTSHKWVLTGLTLLAFTDGIILREQFCKFLCPYGRIQGLFQNDQTLTVKYNEARGEKRSRKKKTADSGDCIDCNMCVRVCPTGIDIRNGAAQPDCISCLRCVDACNTIMGNLNRGEGLIQVSRLEGQGAKAKVKDIFHKRTLLFLAVLSGILILGASRFLNRQDISIQVLNSFGTPKIVENKVRNFYLLKVQNNQLNAGKEMKISFHSEQDKIVLMSSPIISMSPQTEQISFPMLFECDCVGEGSYNLDIEVKEKDKTIKHLKLKFDTLKQ